MKDLLAVVAPSSGGRLRKYCSTKCRMRKTTWARQKVVPGPDIGARQRAGKNINKNNGSQGANLLSGAPIRAPAWASMPSCSIGPPGQHLWRQDSGRTDGTPRAGVRPMSEVFDDEHLLALENRNRPLRSIGRR